MLRFVTHKLKTQSLNEVDQPFEYKSDDDDRDSGTESDDENTEYEDSKEAMENSEEGLEGEGRCISGMFHPSRPPNFDEETSTGSPDDLQYSGTFRDLPTSLLERTAKDPSSHSTSEHHHPHSRGRRGGRSDHRSIAAVDQTSGGGETESATASLSHMPSPVSSSMLDVDSALPSDSDHFEHQSSEEELDVINSKPTTTTTSTKQLLQSRGQSNEEPAVSLSLTSDDDDDDEQEEENNSRQQLRQLPRRSSHRFAATSIVGQPKIKQNRSKSFGGGVTATTNKRNGGGYPHQQSLNLNGCSSTSYHPEKRKWSQANRRSCGDSSAGSSDEEVRDLMYVCSPSTPPVEFCTSPPAELIRPTRSSSSSSNAKSVGLTSSSISGGHSNNNNNNNGNMISTTTNFSAFSYISVSLPCSPSSFITGDGSSSSSVTRSPPAKLFQFSSSNFIPFEVCAVSPRKRHRQSATSCHHHHYPHHQQQLQQQQLFQPVGGTSEAAAVNGRDGNHRHQHQPTNLSNISGSINHISNNVIINQFNNTPTNGCSSSSSSNSRHNNSSNNAAGQRNGAGHHHHPLRQRPCLDFEKMQQVRSRQMSHLRRRCRN